MCVFVCVLRAHLLFTQDRNVYSVLRKKIRFAHISSRDDAETRIILDGVRLGCLLFITFTRSAPSAPDCHNKQWIIQCQPLQLSYAQWMIVQ